MAARHNPPSTQTEGLTVIGGGIHVNGRVSGEEDLRVEGRVEGRIELSETLHVAAEGIVVAEVQARDIVISGVVVGNVTAADSVTLNPGAKLVGDISAPRLIVADGAAFRGNIAMGGEPPPRRERARATARRKTAEPKRAAAAAPARPASPPAKPRVAAVRAPRNEDEVTVVVRHAELEGQVAEAPRKKPAKKKTKKVPPRARVPKPGKRRVTRR
jgi:cytoskeletal protein CcmA (bactofilin family)